ncbi:MAG: choice-of-anchor P family protein [Candidatus Korobacteraceae bacterium]|jgi:hypothetical protein
MDDRSPRTHFYHAEASATGGRIDRPVEQIVPVQAPLSLPSVGGYATARSEDFRFQGILSFQAAQTQVAGSKNERNGGFTTTVSAAVENLNVLNVVTADRVVAQISTEHPSEGYTPKVSFVGTQFVNLRIGGCRIEPVLDLDFCDQGSESEYPKRPCMQNPAFLKKVGEQQQNMRSEQAGTAGPRWGRYVDWLERRYPLPQSGPNPGEALVNERGMVLCSLVQKIKGDCPWKSFGHVIVIPEFGKVILGELLLDDNSFRLIMVRLELGCPVGGGVDVCDAGINGSSYP